MSRARSSVCERVRAQVSLELDGELSQLERAMVAAHLERCGSCRAYEADVTALTAKLRATPPERAERAVDLPRRRRPAALAGQLQVGAAAAVVVVAAGLSILSGSPSPERGATPEAPRNATSLLRFLDEAQVDATPSYVRGPRVITPS